MTVVLEARELHKHFGGVRAVNGVSFQVKEGEILGVIGPNGSGKSTLFNCLLGQLAPSAGQVLLDGRDVTGMAPVALSRLGVSRTFQLLQVFPQLSARENLILAGQEHIGGRISRLFGRPDAGLSAAADRMLDLFRLQHVASLPAGGLSYGQQKLLDAAMAFMAGPRLVLLDEPAGGVEPDIARIVPRTAPGDERRGRIDFRGDRAQHGFRHVALHPGDLYRGGSGDRQRRARGGAQRPNRDRGLSWPLTPKRRCCRWKGSSAATAA